MTSHKYLIYPFEKKELIKTIMDRLQSQSNANTKRPLN